MQKGTILSVDDDPDLQTVVGQYLEDDGYVVLRADTAQEALEKLDIGTLDVILLDLMLPDAEGLSLIQQIRARSNAAIIIVSGKSDTMEKIICLEMGADDYITKPFEMRELSARIKAVLRRLSPANDPASIKTAGGPAAIKAERIAFNDGWVLDRAQFQLFQPEGDSADLTTGEFKLLEALVLSSGRALSREHLFDLTRDGRFDAYDRAIDIQIARIRKKINDTDSEIIKTVRGVGYMFCGTIS